MAKRAVDLSIDELATIGAKAARLAVQKARKMGLVVTGTVDTYKNSQAASSLAQLQPSGTVTLVKQGARVSAKKTMQRKPAVEKSKD